MPVDKPNVIDYVSMDKYENVVLTISDHLEWDEKNEHLAILQEKLNAYLAAIENGELYIKYPDANGKKIIISVMAKYHPNKDGEVFLERVKDAIIKAGYKFYFQVPT